MLRPLIIPQMGQFGSQFIFIHDNAPCYGANILSRELDVKNIICLPLSAHFSNLNPTEKVWEMLRLATHNIPEQPQTLAPLRNAP